MSQSQSPAYTTMAATAVAAGGGAFAVMLQLGEFIGSNFETFLLIVYGDVLFYDVYMIQVSAASFLFCFFGFVLILCSVAWIFALKKLNSDWRSDKAESASDKINQEIKYRRNRRVALIAILRMRRIFVKLERLIDKHLDTTGGVDNFANNSKDNNDTNNTIDYTNVKDNKI